MSSRVATIAIMPRWFLAMALTLVLSPLCLAHGQGHKQIDGDHVRTSEAHLRAAIAEGVAHSPVFRRIVDQLDVSDVIVYVERDCRMPASLVGRLTFMSAAAGRRYVLVRIACAMAPWHEIAMLGHELRHALEIADDTSVVDEESLAQMYVRTGFLSSSLRNGPGYDSQVAIDTGRRVWTELARAGE